MKIVEDVHSEVLYQSSSGEKVYKQSIGSILSKKGLNVCAEFTCSWKLL